MENENENESGSLIVSILSVGLIIWMISGFFDTDSSSETTSEGYKLYDYFKSFNGNADVAGQDENQFIDGKILKQCKIGGKYNAYFGWIKYRQTFLLGIPTPESKPITLYLFVTDFDTSIEGVWRGKENLSAVYASMKAKGCEPPKNI